MEIVNVQIARTHFGYEDHGILTVYVFYDGSGIGGGMGGYGFTKYPAAHAKMMDELIQVFEVDSWEKLPGQYARVECDLGRPTRKIGHLMKDKWFDIEEFAERMRGEMRALGMEVK